MTFRSSPFLLRAVPRTHADRQVMRDADRVAAIAYSNALCINACSPCLSVCRILCYCFLKVASARVSCASTGCGTAARRCRGLGLRRRTRCRRGRPHTLVVVFVRSGCGFALKCALRDAGHSFEHAPETMRLSPVPASGMISDNQPPLRLCRLISPQTTGGRSGGRDFVSIAAHSLFTRSDDSSVVV